MKIFIATVLTLLFAPAIFAQTQAEVIVPSTFIRKAPKQTGEKLQSVQKGEKVVLEKKEATDGWYYVSILNGQVKGWVSANTIRLLGGEETTSQNPPTNDPNKTGAQTSQTSTQTNPPDTNTTSTQSSTQGEPEEVLRVDTEEISLNVRVIDPNNRPVNNLNQSEFTVFENDVAQEITSVSTAQVPINYALVIDNSRSLRSQLGKVAEAGKIIVATNRPGDQSTVVRFINAEKIEVVQDFTSNKNMLDQALDNLFVEGGQTAIIDAVYSAAQRVDQYEKSQKKDDMKRRALIVVSDGDDRSSSNNEQQLFDLLRASDVQIYAIGFVSNLSNEADDNGINRQQKAKTFLTRLAQETGGKVYFPETANELSQIANDISSDLRTQYLVTYSPTAEKNDRSFKNIKVVVSEGKNKEKRTAITRAGRTSDLLSPSPKK